MGKQYCLKDPIIRRKKKPRQSILRVRGRSYGRRSVDPPIELNVTTCHNHLGLLGLPALHRSFANIQFDMVLFSDRCNHAGYCKILHPPFDCDQSLWITFTNSNQPTPPMHQPMRLTLVELFWKPQCYHFSRGGWGVWRDGWGSGP